MELPGLRRAAGAAVHAVLALRLLQDLKGASMNKNIVIVIAVLAAGCGGNRNADQSYLNRPETDAGLMVKDRERVPDMDPSRKISEQDCSKPVDTAAAGNLKCKQ